MEKKHIRNFNIHIALEILILIGFAFFYLSTLLNGKVTMYVHPRIIPFLIFAIIVMAIIAMVFCTQLFRPSGKKTRSWTLLFFVIPLIMAFALPAQSFSSTAASNDEIQLPTTDTANSSAASDQENDNESGNSDITSQLQNGVLIFDNNNYYQYICAIYDDLDTYQGISIELTGFVFKDHASFLEDEFVPARLLMVCCTADMQTVGLLCRWPEASTLTEDTWVKVTGTISKTELDGEVKPIIEANSVETIAKPEMEYIYPY